MSDIDYDSLSRAAFGEPECDTYWGSHGCSRPPEHDGPHLCADAEGACSINDGHWVRFVLHDDSLSEPMKMSVFHLKGQP